MRRLHSTINWLLLIAVLIVPSGISAQEQRAQDQDEPIRLKSDLVTVSASVIDPNGRAIKSLKAADFAIYEDGVKQKIGHFAATERSEEHTSELQSLTNLVCR